MSVLLPILMAPFVASHQMVCSKRQRERERERERGEETKYTETGRMNKVAEGIRGRGIFQVRDRLLVIAETFISQILSSSCSCHTFFSLSFSFSLFFSSINLY